MHILYVNSHENYVKIFCLLYSNYKQHTVDSIVSIHI